MSDLKDILFEYWKDIPGYEGRYKVSNLGRIKSLKRYGVRKDRVLVNCVNGAGYVTIRMENKTNAIHVLMAVTFLGHKPGGYDIIVDHDDNVKTNNILSNLQLISASENSAKNRKNKTGYTGVYKVGTGFCSAIIIKGTRHYLGYFNSPEDAHDKYVLYKKIALSKSIRFDSNSLRV